MRLLALLALVAAPRHAGRLRAGRSSLGEELGGVGAGPRPVGNPSAQPDQRFAFPSAQTGAHDQTLRLVVRPSFWDR